MQATLMGVLLDSSSLAYRAGRMTGRFILGALVPVFVIALVYWNSGQKRQPPMPFSHAISRWWVWVGGLAAGFVLLVALSVAMLAPAAIRQADLEATPSNLAAPTVPAGWTLLRDPADGFEVALPDTWARARTNPTYLDADLASANQAHPGAGDLLRRISGAGSGKFQLVAVDPTPPSGYYTTVGIVLFETEFGASLESQVQDYVTGIRQNGAVQEPVTQQKATVPVGSAIRVEDHFAAQGLSITQTSYVMVHGKNGKAYGVVLFFSYASDQASAMTAAIQQVVDSFRYL